MNRLLANIDIDEVTGCWNWLGTLASIGYGQIKQKKKAVLVHRLVARHALALKLDDPRYVCHRCDNPRCCNPLHLFLGTAGDNSRDSVTKGRHWCIRKRFCKRGHEFTPENTFVKSRGGGRTERVCRTCLHKKQAQVRLNRTPEQRAARKEYMRKWNAS